MTEDPPAGSRANPPGGPADTWASGTWASGTRPGDTRLSGAGFRAG